MRTQLYAHNKTAYQKVMKAFEQSDRTCVVHPTGTGKSYLIAAVSESYQKVLILGPNIFVLDQVHDVLKWRDSKKVAGSVEYMTYSLLMMKDVMPTGYDLICLDEFHRAGAPEWGDAVDRLLEANPTVKVLGTTATPIRFLDDNRDMADELFGGNIASYMTLKDAFDRDILATPRFVTGLFEFSSVADDMAERVSKSRRIDEKEKKLRLTRINNLRLDWERSQGMPQILRKHIDKQAKRIIVFCGNVEKLKDMEQTIREWFAKAGIKVAAVYMMHAYMPDKELSQAMTDFETDTNEGVKLMLSVNMLNEGVHIPRVNAVILLRTTSSKIIYLQQIGRCLTAEKKDKPIILDMVDNITTTNIVHDIKEGFDWYEHQQLNDDEEREPREPKDFVVYDYTLGIRQAIEKLVPVEFNRMSYEERIAMFTAFCDTNQRLPVKADGEEYNNYRTIEKVYPDDETYRSYKEKYQKIIRIDTESRMARLQAFVDANDRLPKKKQEYEEYMNYLILCNRNKETPNERLQAMLDKYKHKETDEELLQRLLDFVAENGRIPSGDKDAPTDEKNLRRYVTTRLMDHPKVKELWQQYSKSLRVSYEERLARLKTFIAKHDRLPNRNDGRDEENNLSQLRRIRKTNTDGDISELIEILDKYEEFRSTEQLKQDILDFYAKHGHLPRSTKGLPREETNLRAKMWKRRDELYSDPDIAVLLADRRREVPQEVKIVTMQEFIAANGRRPMPADGERLFNMWHAMLVGDKKIGDPRVREMYEKYGNKNNKPLEDYIAPLAEFIRREHRLPSTLNQDENILYSVLKNIRLRYTNEPCVKVLLDEIAALPTKSEQMVAKNDEKTRQRIIAFVEEHHRLPKFNAGKEEKRLANNWAARRDRLCQDDPVMQAIADQYDVRPKNFESRYAIVRDWAAEHGRLPNRYDKDVFVHYKVLRDTYRNTPEVQDLLSKYGSRVTNYYVDIDGRLDQIEAFADQHDRLPSTAHSDEMRLGRWWVNIKKHHSSLPRVIALRERFPIQNRK